MRPTLSLPGRHHADAAPIATGHRGLRRLAHGVLLLAVVGATGAYAATAGPDGSDTALPAAAADADVPDLRTAPTPWSGTPSRSHVRLPPATTVSLTVDGETTVVATRAETVSELLENRGIELGPDDEISAPLEVAPADVGAVTVSRVTFTDVTAVHEIPHGNREVPDPAMLSGRRALEIQGKVGTERVVYRVRLVDGTEESREEILRSRVEPVEHVVRVGTKVPPPPRPAVRPAPARAAASTPRPVYSGDPRAIARSMVAARGWGSSQFTCLDRLWTKESGWNPYATNPSSGAYGIPQSLPASKMASAGGDWRTNPATQIRWGLGYIAARYGTPCAAWGHSQAVNWY